MVPEHRSYKQEHKAAECQCHQITSAAEAPPVKHVTQITGGQALTRGPRLWSMYLLVLRDSASKTEVYTAQVMSTA